MKSVNSAMNIGEANAMKDSLAKLQVDLPTHIKYMQVTAVMHRAKYVALVNEGSTKEEALELCKKLFSI